jgi:multidrug efflux pump
VAGRNVVEAGNADPELRDVFSGFRADTPWLFLDLDRVQAEARGVTVGEVNTALQVYFGSLYVNDFNRFGRTWQVNVQAEAGFRERVSGLKRLRVKSTRVEQERLLQLESMRRDNKVPDPTDTAREMMVPLGSFMHVKEETGPVMVQRYNLYPCLI